MSPEYPLLVDVAGRRAVVVGGGPVAARRARGLFDAGAELVVVAPELCEELAELLGEQRVTWLPRPYTAGDLDGAWVVQTATGDSAVDELVAQDAEAARIWCVRASESARSAAWTPAVARVDDVVVAVSAGRDPRRARAIKDRIATQLQTGELPLRRARRGPRYGGSVALVGGGPGDPGLITTRGRRLLADADVVVVDRLAPRSLLDELDPSVEIVEAGKGPNAHTLTQLEINTLLVERAQAGQRVVRLKGGDPFVLGRGGEEAIACAEAGIPCEVVPGVTSAIAVPAMAGIPVTHRGLARSFTVVSAHRAPDGAQPDVDWAAVAGLDGTLVILMGVASLEEVAGALIEHGRSPETPVAIVENGTLPDQRTTTGTLADIAEIASSVGVSSPAVIVVGDVVDVAAGVASP